MRQGTAQKSPQIHKIAAASCCWEKDAVVAIDMPGIEVIADDSITYHADFVKMDIAMAIISISSIVTTTIPNCHRRRARSGRGHAGMRKWKKKSPENRKAGSITQSMSDRWAIDASKNRGRCAPTITTLRTSAAVRGDASHPGVRHRRR